MFKAKQREREAGTGRSTVANDKATAERDRCRSEKGDEGRGEGGLEATLK